MMLAVHTPTIEDYKEIVEYALDIGKNWLGIVNDDQLCLHNWYYFKSETCVIISDLVGLGYGCKNYCKNVDVDIIDMNEFYKNYCLNNIKKLLKDFK